MNRNPDESIRTTSDALGKPPVFGVPAGWIMFHREFNLEKLGPEFDMGCLAPETVDVAILYHQDLLRNDQIPGTPYRVRIRCPEIGMDITGEFQELRSKLVRRCTEFAGKLTGFQYLPGMRSVTTAWQGETRTLIFNPKVN